MKSLLVADLKAKVDSLNANINLNSRYIRDGWIMKSVEAEKRKDR